LPVTYPGAGDALVLLRGQEDEADSVPDVDWNALARLEGTFACYAGGRTTPVILQRLLDAGARPDAPAALVYHGTLAGQHTTTGTLRELLDRTSGDAADAGPALLVVGAVTALRQHLRWFDERPLFGRRIVVTRSPEQAGELVDLLEAL